MGDENFQLSRTPPQGIPGCPRCAWLEARLQRVEQRLSELETRQAQNSDNSHKPPSSDGYAKPDPKNLRKKSGLPSGGQTGHPGFTLSKVVNPDTIVVHRLRRCPCGCRVSLRGQPVLRRETRQVFDLPPQKLIVTEHQVEVKRCPISGREVAAEFPQGVEAPAQYGPRFNAFLVYLRGQQLIPLDRVRQIVADLFGQSISEDTVQSAFSAVFNTLAGFETRVMDLLADADLSHADESGLRVEGSLHWLHTVGATLLTWYGVHKKRGIDAVRHFNILPRFSGRLIHDCLRGYFTLACSHGLCNAHLLRELLFLRDVLHQKWAARMFRLLRRMHRAVLKQKNRAGPPAVVQRAAWIAKYRALLKAGFRQNPEPLPSPHKRRGQKRSKALNLLLRLQEHEASVLAFLEDSSVPFTNNQAERDIRMIKVQQKISGTFRTLSGAQMFARVRAYFSTVRKHNRNVFQETIAAVSGNPFIPCSAS